MDKLKKYLKQKEEMKKKKMDFLEKIWEFPYFDLKRWDVWWKIELLKSKFWWKILVNLRKNNKKF